jgi:hypothetical protein
MLSPVTMPMITRAWVNSAWASAFSISASPGAGFSRIRHVAWRPVRQARTRRRPAGETTVAEGLLPHGCVVI